MLAVDIMMFVGFLVKFGVFISTSTPLTSDTVRRVKPRGGLGDRSPTIFFVYGTTASMSPTRIYMIDIRFYKF